MQIRFGAACLAMVLAACEQRPVTGPSSSPTSPSGPTVPTTGGYTGLVRDSFGSPIAGARISFWPPAAPLFSNESGRFEIPREQYFEHVFASKDGYDDASTDYPSGRYFELTLHNIIRILPGQSARVTVGPNDSYGGRRGAYRVRAIRVYTGGDRIVHIEVLADDNGPAEYWIQNDCGDVCPVLSSPSTFSISGGRELLVWIQIPADSTVSRTFTVNTSGEEP